jgi:hypothetical protein
LLGGLLGLIDGLSALLYPGTAAMILPIVVGSTIKGLVTGIANGCTGEASGLCHSAFRPAVHLDP